MSTLAELPDLVGFFSYSREDDEAFKGALSALRDGIYRELSAELGRSKTTFRLWQDQAAIAPGKLWESEIKAATDEAVFFIPIVTPRAVKSKYCKFEFEAFLAREKDLGRNDLVFPILYITVPTLEDEAKWRDDPVLSTIAQRQYVDWRPLRHLDVQSTTVRERIEGLCRKIVDALNEPWVSPEERQREEGAKARQRAEEEARRLQSEAKLRAEVEEARKRAEGEAKRRAQAEEARRRAEAEDRQRAEEERRRQEAEAKRWAAQEQAFAAARRADDISAVDAFLANHPESRHTAEARTLREALLARDEACKAAMTSSDPAVLKAFLKTYPKGAPADQVRGRLRSVEPQTAFSRHRRLFVLLLLSFVAVGILVVSLTSGPDRKSGESGKGKELLTSEPDRQSGEWEKKLAENLARIGEQRCAEARRMQGALGDFTTVMDSRISSEARQSSGIPSPYNSMQAINQCAANCRKIGWCRAFTVGPMGSAFADPTCNMYADIKTEPSDTCPYWFRRN